MQHRATFSANTTIRWAKFVLFLIATSKDTAADAVKTALLLRTIGRRGNLTYDYFTWENADGNKVCGKVIKLFDEYCKPKVNLIAKTHALLTCKQGNRTVDERLTELHTIAGLCDLEAMYDRMVLHALVLGIENSKVRKKLFEQGDLDLQNAIKRCRQEETTALDYKAVTRGHKEEQANAVKHKSPYRSHPECGYRPTKSKGPDTKTNSDSNTNCWTCSSSHPP